MANSIERASKFLPIIDDIYKYQSVTQRLDTNTRTDFTNANEVKVLKVTTTGLGDYDRSTGYPKGDVTASWETLKLEEERGKEISIDRMDDEETFGLTFGTVIGNFVRDFVTPELDAYRFSKYASKAGIQKVALEAALTTGPAIIDAIDEAVRALDAEEVPEAGRILYINSDLKPLLNGALERRWGSDSTVNTVLDGYNGMPIVWVPRSRFYTAITLNAGTSSWGYVKDSNNGKDINFMLIYPEAVVQAKKFALPKIFTPDENQEKDAWKFQFRLYHDCFVYDNKVKGVYLHNKPKE